MELQTSSSTFAAKLVAHRLPCTVHANGEARTARAFCPFPETIKSFRGHALQAGDIQIPESFRSELCLADTTQNMIRSPKDC